MGMFRRRYGTNNERMLCNHQYIAKPLLVEQDLGNALDVRKFSDPMWNKACVQVKDGEHAITTRVWGILGKDVRTMAKFGV